MKLNPLADRVVVKMVEMEETTKSGIILTAAAKEKPQIAQVVEVGPGGMVDGKEIVMNVQVGDKVITSKYSGTEVKFGNEEYIVVKANKVYTDTPDAVAFSNMTRFQEDPNEQVFLGTFGKCGTGFTLNSSMYLVCIDTPYTFSLFEQGYQRVHRISNTRPAFIKVLVCEETIDERVQEIIETKKDLGEYLVDGVGDGTVDSRLTDELRSILRDL